MEFVGKSDEPVQEKSVEQVQPFSIPIGDFTFTLISKSVGDGKAYDNGSSALLEDRNKIYFTSTNTTTREIEKNYAYASVSDGYLWRLCYLHNGNPDKFQNYLQSTVIHMELQVFINANFNELPYCTTDQLIVPRFTSDKNLENNEYTDHNPNGVLGCPITDEVINTYIGGTREIEIGNHSELVQFDEFSAFIENNYDMTNTSELPTKTNTYANVSINIKLAKVDLTCKNTAIYTQPVGTTLRERLKPNYNLFLPEYSHLCYKDNQSSPLKPMFDELVQSMENITIFCGEFTCTDTDTKHSYTNHYNAIIVPTNSKIDKYGLYVNFVKGFDKHFMSLSYISKPMDYRSQSRCDDIILDIKVGYTGEPTATNYVIKKEKVDNTIFPLNRVFDLPPQSSADSADVLSSQSSAGEGSGGSSAGGGASRDMLPPPPPSKGGKYKSKTRKTKKRKSKKCKLTGRKSKTRKNNIIYQL